MLLVMSQHHSGAVAVESKIASGSNTWTNEAESGDMFLTGVDKLFGQGYGRRHFFSWIIFLETS